MPKWSLDVKAVTNREAVCEPTNGSQGSEFYLQTIVQVWDLGCDIVGWERSDKTRAIAAAYSGTMLAIVIS